jgi:hypothetical protein
VLSQLARHETNGDACRQASRTMVEADMVGAMKGPHRSLGFAFGYGRSQLLPTASQ